MSVPTERPVKKFDLGDDDIDVETTTYSNGPFDFSYLVLAELAYVERGDDDDVVAALALPPRRAKARPIVSLH